MHVLRRYFHCLTEETCGTKFKEISDDIVLESIRNSRSFSIQYWRVNIGLYMGVKVWKVTSVNKFHRKESLNGRLFLITMYLKFYVGLKYIDLLYIFKFIPKR